jgi:hypothetical protein
MKGKDKAETRRKRRLLLESEGALHLPIFEFCKRLYKRARLASPRLEFHLCYWLVRRLRKYPRTPRWSNDSLAVLACLATLFSRRSSAQQVISTAVKPRHPSSLRLFHHKAFLASILASCRCLAARSEVLFVHGRGRENESGAFRLFICLWHAINPAHPSKR